MAGIKNHKIVEKREINGVQERKCTWCDQWKTVDQFYSNCKHNAYWVDSNCKQCRKERALERQKTHKDELNQNKRNKKLNERGIQSPFNYLANKYLLLPQMKPLLPETSNVFVDLFAGSCTVGINNKADRIVCNDKDSNVIGFLNACKNHVSEYIISQILGVVDEYRPQESKENFDRLREIFNGEDNGWDVFYALTVHSFNQHPLYNAEGKFRTGWGNGLCYFNSMLQKRIHEFVQHIKTLNIEFVSSDFKNLDLSGLGSGDFIYADPPYLLSSKTYEWSEDDEAALLGLLKTLDTQGVKFALSNVFKHKKGMNTLLIEWSKKYNVTRLQRNYSRMSRGNDKDSFSTEVLVRNYE
jgi:DNA adenine methylase Dam